MVLFRKKEDSTVPNIPPLPEFPKDQRERELPSLPREFNEAANRDIIKSAVGDGFGKSNDFELPNIFNSEEGSIPSPPNLSSEHERFLPPRGMAPSILEPEPKFTEPKTSNKEINNISGPDSIFIRIDKFRAARKELTGIKKSLFEAEALINKIKEIKVREDTEVGDINLSLDSIKKKIDEIDSLVFNKV
jgi:hypothetical protein